MAPNAGAASGGCTVTDERPKRPNDADLRTVTLPDGGEAIFPARPGVVLYAPAGINSTGVCDLEWVQAWRHIGTGYPIGPYEAGWPRAMDAGALAVLQFPPDGIEPCSDEGKRNSDLQSWCFMAFVSRHGPDYKVTPLEFVRWLREQGQSPSHYIAAWAKANGVPAPATTPEASAQQAEPPRGTAPKLNDSQRMDVVRRYRGGAKVAALAREFGVHPRTIDAVLSRAGAKQVTPRDKPKGGAGGRTYRAGTRTR